ncbi:hypothetical protein CLF_100935 [Clonorchis sinensis]|uniref:Uncharacterized protein n=1 Tax=Clonorchis sinensis TaxID=79923 RepID=G7Y4K6_CLOSI|nr:hypothetical protein CLF_100935 [Clonorchis sinensis]
MPGYAEKHPRKFSKFQATWSEYTRISAFMGRNECSQTYSFLSGLRIAFDQFQRYEMVLGNRVAISHEKQGRWWCKQTRVFHKDLVLRETEKYRTAVLISQSRMQAQTSGLPASSLNTQTFGHDWLINNVIHSHFDGISGHFVFNRVIHTPWPRELGRHNRQLLPATLARTANFRLMRTHQNPDRLVERVSGIVRFKRIIDNDQDHREKLLVAMMFSFTGGRTPSNITATCITMAGSPSATQCPSEYKMTPTGAEVTACCKTANCNALPGIGSEPNIRISVVLVLVQKHHLGERSTNTSAYLIKSIIDNDQDHREKLLVAMMFSFTGGRTPSNITATCITMAGSPSATQCPSEYKMTPTGAEVTACCKTANCNALPGIGSEGVNIIELSMDGLSTGDTAYSYHAHSRSLT